MADSDRVGMRLDGLLVGQARNVGFTSDGTAPGSIQVTGSGQPIVLLADRQTTGGYPKIATIISARARLALRCARVAGASAVDVERPRRALDNLFGDHHLLDTFEARQTA